jgi:hypothetical protein
VKSFVPYIFIAGITAAIVLYQPLAVFGADDFTMTRDGYKVFSYGFPFRIVGLRSGFAEAHGSIAGRIAFRRQLRSFLFLRSAHGTRD